MARTVYGTREKQKILWVPLDALLSLPGSIFSYLLQDWAQEIAVRGPFCIVNEVLSKILGIKLSVNSLERMNRNMSNSVEEYWEQETMPIRIAPKAEHCRAHHACKNQVYERTSRKPVWGCYDR